MKRNTISLLIFFIFLFLGYSDASFWNRPGPVSPTSPTTGTYTCCHWQTGSVWTTGAPVGTGCPGACGKNTTGNTYSCCVGLCTCSTCTTCKPPRFMSMLY